MAPKRIQALLATESEDGRAGAAGRDPTAACADGEREPNLGTRADCRRTVSETWRRSVTANGGAPAGLKSAIREMGRGPVHSAGRHLYGIMFNQS